MVSAEKNRILLIEDELHIAEGLKLNLTLQGYEVDIASDGGSGLQKWRDWRPDLIVLDIMLPVIDGLSVLRNIRLEDERIPILILSAKGASHDKIKGLTYGVDDYLTKPFNLEEFLLRIDRLLARSAWASEQEIRRAKNKAVSTDFSFGENHIDFESAVAHCKSGTVRLTEQEVKLLKLFIAHRGRPLARHKMLEIGWGYTGVTHTRTVDNFMVRFRKYFEKDPKNPVYFKSIRSVGYQFDPEPGDGE